MIIRLGNLRSTRVQGERKIHVDLATDSPPDTAKLTITVVGCGPTAQLDAPIGPGGSATFSYTHQCEGRCVVTVKETQTGLETEKYLDLDATSSD
jgi:hypothetical protein